MLPLLLLFHVPYSAQPQVPHFNDHLFDKSCVGDITCIVQDDRGFVWIGSTGGLFRYDGKSYQPMTFGDSSNSPHVTALLPVESDTFWVGCEDGSIYRLNRHGFLEPWVPEEGLPQQSITGFVTDQSGDLWFSTYGEGLYVKHKSHVYNFDQSDGLLADQIYAITMDDKGRIWAATDQGVSLCTMANGQKIVSNIQRSDGLNDEIVYHLMSIGKDVWLGFQSGGICRIDVRTDSITYQTSEWTLGEIRSMIPASEGEIWLGTGMGMVTYDVVKDVFSDPSQLNQEALRSVDHFYVDREWNLWCAGAGNHLYSGNLEVKIISGEVGDIQAVLADQEGNVWLGTAHGLYHYMHGRFEKVLAHQQNIISLYQDEAGLVWMGTFGSGVLVCDPKNGQERWITEADGLMNGSVLSIDGNHDRVWLATLGGIAEISKSARILEGGTLNLIMLDQINDHAASFFYTVYVDSRDIVWFGSDGDGVIKLENEVLISMLEENKLPAKTIYSFTEDPNGHIWIGTATEGLYRWDGKQYQRFARLHEGPELPIAILASDPRGHILIGHTEGLDILDIRRDFITSYGEEAGLREFNPAMNAMCQSDQITWLGGVDQLIMIRSAPATMDHQPNLVIDKVRILGSIIDHESDQSFKSHENYLQFDVVGLWFTNPSELTHAYKLEGYDMDWKITSDQQISYSHLQPGQYHFQLAPVIDGQTVQNASTSYSFVINPPWWQTPWFISLAVSACLLGLWWLQRYREKKVSLEATMARERIESQYEVLKAQINPHFLFNSFNTLASIVEENTSQAIEYIEKLSDYYRSIIQLRDQKLVRVETELDLVKDFVFLLGKRFGTHLDVHMDVQDCCGWIPPLSLQMLVENAVKHNVISRQKPLRIDIIATPDKHITVMNNLQPKMTRVESTQFGLQNIKNRFEMLSSKKVLIEQTSTHFSVSIPLIDKETS